MRDQFGQHIPNRDQGHDPGLPTEGDPKDDAFRVGKSQNYRERQVDRANQIRRDEDKQANVSVTLEDVDRAILYQFEERFNFHVEMNGQRIKVPVIYNKQERWNWAKNQRHLRSVGEKVVFPIITFERTAVSRDTQHENMNTLNKQLATFDRTGENVFIGYNRYSKQNRYDRFSILQGRHPVKEFYVVTVPNYVVCSYDFMMYTEYVYQMNDIVEQIGYMGQEYWGNPDGHFFKTMVDSFTITTEGEDGSRYVRADFTAQVNGYVVPEYVMEEARTQRAFTNAKVVTEERIVRPEDIDDALNGRL